MSKFTFKPSMGCIAAIHAIPLLYTFIAPLSAHAQGRDSLRTRHYDLQTAEVVGNSLHRVNNSALNAIAIDVNKLKNTTLDVAGILNKVSGVKIRQNGGVGSATAINLNGFTGKHVKVFMDGVPMDGTSSSFSLNNLPASLVSAVEVYKGVVPVEFGADALGGAINIVTNRVRRTSVDASYAYGSYNTHRTSLNLNHVSQHGWLFSLNAYHNASDNNYKVKVQNLDLQTMAFSHAEQWYRRYNDAYNNTGVVAQVGRINLPWADRLTLGLTYSREHAEIQHANLMKIVFGEKYRQSHGFTPSLNYQKRDLFTPGLDLRVTAKYDIATTNNVDTVARRYNWAGEYVTTKVQGEGVPTIAEFRSKTATIVTHLKYRWADHHFLALNNTYTHFHRQTIDRVANAAMQVAANAMPRKSTKDVLGLEYKYVPSRQWNALAMAKYYHTTVYGPVNIVAGRNEYELRKRTSDALGFGVAGTWRPNRHWQVKASLERTIRLPNERELFGDGDYEQGETKLRPEQSYNANLNLIADHRIGKVHFVSLELGMNYRHIRDFIIRGFHPRGTAISMNHGTVIGYGLDMTAHYNYRNQLMLNASYTLQSMRNRERLTAHGAPSQVYNDQMPNLPYAFGHVDLSYRLPGFLGRKHVLTFNYGLNHTHRFYRSWRNEGAHIFIPQQLSHDASVVYALHNGRYNVALEANNFTNALLYDNYSLQKPGRYLGIKLRYFFHK